MPSDEAAASDSDAQSDDAEGFRLLAPPAVGRREASPAAVRPVAPPVSAPVEEPADAAEATDWYQPPVASTMPYEFPSTGSVRLIPPPGRGSGARPAATPPTARPFAAAPSPAAPSATGRPAVSPAPPRPARPAATATSPADAAAARAVPRRVVPDRAASADPVSADPAVAPDRASKDPVAMDRATTERTLIIPGPSSPAATSRATTERTAAASAAGRAGAPAAVVPRLARGDLFGRHTRSYAAENSGQQVTILQAGCTTAEDLDVEPLRAAGARLSVSMIDEDSEVTRAAVAHHQSMSGAILGDLRIVPLPPRAYDIVQCSSLLDRIEHAELVLDRLSAAVKPGGLLLLRIRDRDSAGGFLDRALPGLARRAIWRKRKPGEPGPHTAVYERLASSRGVQAYVLMHGLVIAERGALGGLAGGLRRGPHGYLTAQKLVAWLSRGRLTSAHEDLLYVIRKPEDRFARIL
jgi:hypothetical protein